jgi:hypothetical protein
MAETHLLDSHGELPRIAELLIDPETHCGVAPPAFTGRRLH